MNTKYNTLYNGNLAFEEGRQGLNDTYRDNYWEILPVERMEVTDDIKLDSEDNNPNFIIAEEKAAKAIQKHSMMIKDTEHNPQTDEAFLLLGKARYFDQRYIPALEAFNYILNRYTYSDKLNEAVIWREKVNIRLENEEIALENLKRLLKLYRLKDQEYADARAMMGQAYINLKVVDTAIQQLKIASAYTRKNPEKGRYYYIIGQLYNQLGKKDSANMAFDQVIALNRSSPRVYKVNAELQKIQNTVITEENKEAVFEFLSEMEENRENRPFLNKIYHQLAQYHLGDGSDSLALDYFNKSLRATERMPQLNALNYEAMALYNFEDNNYKVAGAYYDSVLLNLPENTNKYRVVKKKLDNLQDVIKYEDIAKDTDSIISLYEMPLTARETYFKDYIAQLRAAKEEAQKGKDKLINTGVASFGNAKGGKDSQGKFYFYNVTALGYGKTDFKSRWGNRVLEDDWRWSTKTKVQAQYADTPMDRAEAPLAATDEQQYNLDFYLESIPQEEAIIDSLRRERNFANYQLGLIYKEKFKENHLAAAKLEAVLKSAPEERLIIPSKYNLYKIYEEEGSPLVVSMKNDIIANHPESRYAEILINPQAILQGSVESPDAKYGELYKMFQNQEYVAVIAQAEENIAKYTGDPIVPKLEMLKANAIGRVMGYEDFKEALNFVALNYPNHPEGKKAQAMVNDLLPRLSNTDFIRASEEGSRGNWKLVFPMKIKDNAKALKLKALLEKSMKDLKYTHKISKDIYTIEDQFVIVHGFLSEEYALGYAELLKNNKDYLVNDENFVILSTNYKIVQIHKNLQAYRAQQ
ncbi:protein involved in gliding motility SprE [Arenibacter nanhaiticus]|uniref:Protein involved in gliding motility SprE n=2 Tax=Arenibacter nanhaiticus TaxID=558155 RepID=A0A1M6A6C4_9FLAO|nr:protein involved in gliding motility SprE [Arenibacter nanhaiticus]